MSSKRPRQRRMRRRLPLQRLKVKLSKKLRRLRRLHQLQRRKMLLLLHLPLKRRKKNQLKTKARTIKRRTEILMTKRAAKKAERKRMTIRVVRTKRMTRRRRRSELHHMLCDAAMQLTTFKTVVVIGLLEKDWLATRRGQKRKKLTVEKV